MSESRAEEVHAQADRLRNAVQRHGADLDSVLWYLLGALEVCPTSDGGIEDAVRMAVTYGIGCGDLRKSVA